MRSEERRVWIAQCLDPERHCILAALGEADSQQEAEAAVADPLRRAVADLVRQGEINPWCGLCGAEEATWHVEVGRTRWRTTSDVQADPLFRQLRAANDLSRALHGDTHRGRRH